VEVALKALIAVQRCDGEALAALLHDDLVQLDHRPIGYPDLDKAGLVDVVRAQSGLTQVWLNQKLHVASSTASVSTGSSWTLSFGHWSPFERGVYLGVLDDGQLVRNEVLPEDQLDAALARFVALPTEPEPAAPDRVSSKSERPRRARVEPIGTSDRLRSTTTADQPTEGVGGHATTASALPSGCGRSQDDGWRSAVSASRNTLAVSATVRLRTRRSRSIESSCVSELPASSADERARGDSASSSEAN